MTFVKSEGFQQDVFDEICRNFTKFITHKVGTFSCQAVIENSKYGELMQLFNSLLDLNSRDFLDIATDKAGSRVVQEFVKELKEDDFFLLAGALKNDLEDLVCTQHGSFLGQKIVQRLRVSLLKEKFIGDIMETQSWESIS